MDKDITQAYEAVGADVNTHLDGDAHIKEIIFNEAQLHGFVNLIIYNKTGTVWWKD